MTLEGEGHERLEAICQFDRERALAELGELLDEAPEREVKLLLFLADRYIAIGLRQYGPLEFNDGRNNTIERMMELADEQFYWAKDEFGRAESAPRRCRRRCRAVHRFGASAKWRRHRALLKRSRRSLETGLGQLDESLAVGLFSW